MLYEIEVLGKPYLGGLETEQLQEIVDQARTILFRRSPCTCAPTIPADSAETHLPDCPQHNPETCRSCRRMNEAGIH